MNKNRPKIYGEVRDKHARSSKRTPIKATHKEVYEPYETKSRAGVSYTHYKRRIVAL